MIELYDFQKKIIKRILNKIEKFNLYMLETPTGSGKSIIIAFLIRELKKKYPDKKIIVSTHTIQLSMELLGAFEKIADNDEDFDLVVGKENYLDLNNLDFSCLNEFIFDIKVVIKKLEELIRKEKNRYLLIDIFLDRLDLDESEKDILKLELKNSKKKEYIRDFDKVDISFTNHFYLLSKFLYDKHFNPEDYIIIFDEFHLVSDSAEVLYSYNFSIYRYVYLLKKVIKSVENESKFSGQKTFLRKLYKHLNFSKYVSEKIKNKKLAGQGFINDEKYSIGPVNRIFKLNNKELPEMFKKYFQKISRESKENIELFLKEHFELKEIISANPREVAVCYSSLLGFPKFSVTKGDVRFKLKEYLWNRINKVIGMSATLTIDKEDSSFIEKRLGIDLSDIKSYFYRKEPVFSIKQINYYFVDKSFPKPVTDEIEVSKEWVGAIVDKVKETFEYKNSMIITGGFLEVDEIANKLKAKIPDVNIVKAERKKSVFSIIEKFKKEGGILVATRNYGTGVNLEGEKLEKLYIAKLPYPIISNKKWIDLRKYDKLNNTNLAYFLMENEMLLNLKQYIGRLIRTKEDKGDLYILDSRINKNFRKERIETMIKNSFKT